MTKKIAYIITRSDIGGAQNHVRSLIEYFSNRYQLMLITGSEGPLTSSARSAGAGVYVVDALDSYSAVSAVRDLRTIFASERPHLVHTHSSLASIYGRIAAKISGISVLYTVHGWHFANLDGRIRALFQIAIEMFARPITNHWVTVSEFDARLGAKYRLFSKDAVECIPNGVADNGVQSSRLSDGTLKAVFVGRASYQKNPRAAVSVLERTNERVHLTMYVSGDGVDDLLSCLAKSPAKARCQVVVDDPNAAEFLDQYDLLLVTSRYEGMPLSVLEALRAGLAIISTDVCGMNEVVRPANGYLVDDGDIAGMADCINHLSDHRSDLMALQQASRAMYLNEFTLPLMLSRISLVYSRLLDQ